jgi:hypothetical protein
MESAARDGRRQRRRAAGFRCALAGGIAAALLSTWLVEAASAGGCGGDDSGGALCARATATRALTVGLLVFLTARLLAVLAFEVVPTLRHRRRAG